MSRLTFFLSLLLFTGNLFAQQATVAQAAADLRLVNQAYNNAKLLRMEIGYNLFADYSSTVPVQQEKGLFLRQERNTYSNLLGTVTLNNSRVSLTLDSAGQAIIVSDPLPKSRNNPQPVNLDSLLQQCSAIDFHADAGKKYYKLHFDKAPFMEYAAVEIYINSSSNFIEKLVLYFRESVDLNEEDDVVKKSRPRLEIAYSNISTTPVFSAQQFSESQFISGAGKRMSCTPAYSAFRLINNKLQ
jgi:hypothetical protein